VRAEVGSESWSWTSELELEVGPGGESWSWR
jgi:hypothetical protein